MKLPLLIPIVIALSSALHAETAKSFQVTGPILALTDNVITVQKGDERWEIARAAGTKVDGKLAVGARVTVHYKMSAEKIEVKDAAAKSADKADRAVQKAADKADKKTPR